MEQAITAILARRAIRGPRLLLCAMGLSTVALAAPQNPLELRQRWVARYEGLPALLATQRLDVVIAPTRAPAAVTDLSYGDRGLGGSARAAAVSGCPHVTLPCGYVKGPPVGISFMGARFDDARAIALVHAFEQVSKARQGTAIPADARVIACRLARQRDRCSRAKKPLSASSRAVFAA